MKVKVYAVLMSFGAVVGSMVGAFDQALKTLAVVMLLDYITGFMTAAMVKNSPKTSTGGLSSAVGLIGLFKKIAIFICVILANQIDLLIGTEAVRDGVIFCFIANEAVSIVENAGLLGVPIPATLKNAIDILRGDNE